MAARPRVLSLCSGVGGLDLAVRLALDGRTVCYVEREAFAAACLVARMAEAALDPAPVWDDLGSFDGRRWRGAVDLVCTGIPCQPASVAGKRQGFDDERWLWPMVARVLEEAAPTALFLENVRGLLSVNAGSAFASVVDDLVRLGYRVAWLTLAASDVGAPHGRARVFVLAVRDGVPLLPSPDLRPLEAFPMPFPPPPGATEAWAEVIACDPALSPAVEGDLDYRIDRLRACGNGVVPLQAAVALRLLIAQLSSPLPGPLGPRPTGKWWGAGYVDGSGAVEWPSPVAKSGRTPVIDAPRKSGQAWPTPRASENENRGVTVPKSHTEGHGRALASTAATWPTPMCADGERGSEHGIRGESNPTLLGAMRARLWPTPKTPSGGPEVRLSRAARGSGGEDLAARAQQWATPTAGDSKAAGSRGVGEDAVAHIGVLPTDQTVRGRMTVKWQTPRTEDGESCGGCRGTASKPLLNPFFVEWMMGWPVGWTDPDGEVEFDEWFAAQRWVLDRLTRGEV